MKNPRDRDCIPVTSRTDAEKSTLSFKPHITQRLTELEHPKTSIDHEVLHTLRESYDDRASTTARSSSSNSLDYSLWLEVGKHSHKPTYATSLDGKPPINFNIWRNYRRFYSDIHPSPRRSSARSQSRLNDKMAFEYPIIIPAPSHLGDNHLRQFFEANRKEFFQNQSHFRMALIKADNDERLLRLLSLKSQQRNQSSSDETAKSTRMSVMPSIQKPSSASTTRRQLPPPNSLNVSPQRPPRPMFSAGKKFLMKDNHPAIEKLKFEQELKTAITFHRELKRVQSGHEKSLFARHNPV